MAPEPKVPPEAVAYVRALLARAAALGVPAAALAMPLSRNQHRPLRPALQMRAAVAHAVARAGIWRSVFRLIPETADAETRMRDAARRLELLTPQVEALIAALTRGLTYTPPPPLLLPLSAPAAEAIADARAPIAQAVRALGPGVLQAERRVGDPNALIRERATLRAAVVVVACERKIPTKALIVASGLNGSVWYNAAGIAADPDRQAEIADPAAAIRGRPRGPKLRSALLDPWRYEDDPAAVAADLTGKAPSAPTWAPPPEEQGYGA